MKPWTQALPFFPKHELEDRDTGVILLDPHFAVHLPVLRLMWGYPMYPTSVVREPDTNRRVDGHPNSLHLTKNPKHPTQGSMAMDVYWGDWPIEMQLAFCKLAWSLGWSIGLNLTFAHIDRRIDIGLTQNVFKYSNWDDSFSKSDFS